MSEPLACLLLFGVGLVAGTLNVIAGGGSFITLPILIFLGLPAPMANGTNRLAILFQNVGAVWGFKRHKITPWRYWGWAAGAAAAGAAVGALLVFHVDDETFKRLLATLMVVMTVWTLLGKGASEPVEKPPPVWLVCLGFFAIGIYGGFVQAGVGFLLLATTSAFGLDLVRGNVVKVRCVLVFSVVALAIFLYNGVVDWTLGLSLGAGSVIGSQLGVRLTVTRGHRWVKLVVSAMVLVFAAKLWIG